MKMLSQNINENEVDVVISQSLGSSNLLLQNGTPSSRTLSTNVQSLRTPDTRNNNGNSVFQIPSTSIAEEEDTSDIVTDFDTVSKIQVPRHVDGSELNMPDAYLSGIKPENLKAHSNSNSTNQNTLRQGQVSAPNTPETMRRQHFLLRHSPSTRGGNGGVTENVNVRMSMQSSVPSPAAKRDKMEFNQMMMRMNCEMREGRPLSYHGKSISHDSSPFTIASSTSLTTSPIVSKRHVGSPSNSPRLRNKESTLINRRSMPVGAYLENRIRDKFDISELDTNLPRIDIEAIENHLRLAREEERKRRSDRDEIRRRLALESEEMNEKSGGRKPSLHSRLQSTSDSESPGSDTEVKNSQQPASLPHVNIKAQNSPHGNDGMKKGNPTEDFYARHARLQADARHALSQAKDLAKLQMSHEKDNRRYSPITEMVRNSLLKVGITLPPERRRVSRQLLTEMNVAQLQVIVNDLHTHIEELNEKLVSMLLDRDDLHMEQDSMLVDIEDLTRYLAAKDNSPHQSLPLIPPAKALLGKK